MVSEDEQFGELGMDEIVEEFDGMLEAIAEIKAQMEELKQELRAFNPFADNFKNGIYSGNYQKGD